MKQLILCQYVNGFLKRHAIKSEHSKHVKMVRNVLIMSSQINNYLVLDRGLKKGSKLGLSTSDERGLIKGSNWGFLQMMPAEFFFFINVNPEQGKIFGIINNNNKCRYRYE
jgi:hypothetical protein